MAYKARAKVEQEVSLRNAGITIHVWLNGRKLGRFQLNKAGVKLLGAHKSTRGPDVSWRRLATIMKKHAEAKAAKRRRRAAK